MNRETGWPLATLLATLLLVPGQHRGALPAGWWLLPWGLSLVLFGLPHGALDHEVVLGLWKPAWATRPALSVVLVGYLAVSLLVLLGWFVAPRAVFLGFILLTWGHWGLADLWWSWRRDPAYFHGRFHRAVFACWRGALPMLVPLAADPDLYRQTAETTCNLFLHGLANFRWMESGALRSAALGFVLLLGLADFLLARRGSRSRWLNAVEGLALLIFFGVLPAVVSVGFYFAFWHGLRHVLRLLPTESLTWSGFARRALPATLGALCLLGMLAVILMPRIKIAQSLGVYLALIAALTVPHAVVVTCMDLRDGLWAPLPPDEPARDLARR